jgi:hypothetical protein
MPDKEYPVGTILQLVPFEAMVKHPHEKFPKTNGWEFFALEVSEGGTKIRDRGRQRRQSFTRGHLPQLPSASGEGGLRL